MPPALLCKNGYQSSRIGIQFDEFGYLDAGKISWDAEEGKFHSQFGQGNLNKQLIVEQ